MTRTLPTRGPNIRRYLEGLGIRVLPISASRQERPNNVMYGRARVIGRLMRANEEQLTTALRCIQASNPRALHADIVLAVFDYIGAHMANAARTEAVIHFRAIDIGDIRERALTLARGKVARRDAAYILIANSINYQPEEKAA